MPAIHYIVFSTQSSFLYSTTAMPPSLAEINTEKALTFRSRQNETALALPFPRRFVLIFPACPSPSVTTDQTPVRKKKLHQCTRLSNQWATPPPLATNLLSRLSCIELSDTLFCLDFSLSIVSTSSVSCVAPVNHCPSYDYNNLSSFVKMIFRGTLFMC